MKWEDFVSNDWPHHVEANRKTDKKVTYILGVLVVLVPLTIAILSRS